MSVLNRISFYQGRRDEVPNQELARTLARTKNRKGIAEIAANLHHENRNVQSDCLKVLYEVGYEEPDLIAGHVDEFLDLLNSKNNRLVWGSMIALASISRLQPRQIWERIDDVIAAIRAGSVITVVAGVKTLAGVASTKSTYRARLFPILLQQIRDCIPRDVPTHAENMLVAVDEEHKAQFLAVLDARKADLSPSQAARLRKVLRRLDAESAQ